jgi:ABC-type polysaccharide/polyol phosphate export permease
VLGNMLWLTALIAILSARFRDVPQIVANILQIMFFLTPIIWRTDRLGGNMQFVADINPLYHFIELLRAPLLGMPIEMKHWTFSILSLVIGSAVTFVFFARYRSRIPYWL